MRIVISGYGGVREESPILLGIITGMGVAMGYVVSGFLNLMPIPHVYQGVISVALTRGIDGRGITIVSRRGIGYLG